MSDIRLRVIPIRMMEAGVNGSDADPLELIIKEDTEQLFFKALDDSILEIKGRGYDAFMQALHSLYTVDDTPVIAGGKIPSKAVDINSMDTDLVVRFDKSTSFENYKEVGTSDFTRESCHIVIYKKGEKPKLVMPKVYMKDVYIHSVGEFQFWANNSGKVPLPDIITKIFNLYNGTSLINYDNTLIDLNHSYTYLGTPINPLTNNAGAGKSLNTALDTRMYFLAADSHGDNSTFGWGPNMLLAEDRMCRTYLVNSTTVKQDMFTLLTNQQYSRVGTKVAGNWTFTNWVAGILPIVGDETYDFKRYPTINDIVGVLPLIRRDSSTYNIKPTGLGDFIHATKLEGIASWDDITRSGFFYTNYDDTFPGGAEPSLPAYRYCSVYTTATGFTYQSMNVVCIDNGVPVADRNLFNSTTYTRYKSDIEGQTWSGWVVETGYAEPRKAETTYKDNIDFEKAAIRSHRTDNTDAWIYLDRQNPKYGVYHRRESTPLTIADEETLPSKSLAYIGNNSLVHYLCLDTGNGYFKGEVKAKTLLIDTVSHSVTDAFAGIPNGMKYYSVNGNMVVNGLYSKSANIGSVDHLTSTTEPTTPTGTTFYSINGKLTATQFRGDKVIADTSLSVAGVSHSASDTEMATPTGAKFYCIDGKLVVNVIIAKSAKIGGVTHTTVATGGADPGVPAGTDFYTIDGRLRSKDIKVGEAEIAGVRHYGGTTNPTATTRHNIDGYVYATRVYNAVWNDLAEYFEKEKGSEAEPGDIICAVGGGKFDKSEYGIPYNPNVVGVYSDTAGQILGGNGDEHDDENFILVGLSGRVNVKVVGEARIGDFIVTSSIPGVGQAASRCDINSNPGTVVGKVLQNKHTSGIERISILIMNR